MTALGERSRSHNRKFHALEESGYWFSDTQESVWFTISNSSNLCTVYRKHAKCVSIIGLILLLMVIRDDSVRRGLLPHSKILAIFRDTVPAVGSGCRI